MATGSDAVTEPPGAGAASPALRRRAQLVVAASAAWAWVLVVVAPALEVGAGGARGVALAALFPALVSGGLWLDALAFGHRGARRRLAEAVLAGLAPLALVGALAGRPELAAADVIGPLHGSLVGVASAAYLASVAWLAGTHAARRAGQSQALPAASRARPARWSQGVRLALLGTVTAAAVAFVGVAPAWTGHAGRAARFGEAGAESAALLAGVVGLALSVVVLGAIVGPSLRARGASDALPSSYRGALWLAVALLAVLAWAWLERAA